MRANLPLAAALCVPLVLTSAAGAARAAEAPPTVLPVTAGLRAELARVYARHDAGRHHRLVVEKAGAHHGRVGGAYYAVLKLWYRDSPTRNTDAGTGFTKAGPKGHWKITMVDGAYDPCARPAPERLMRAWHMRVAQC